MQAKIWDIEYYLKLDKLVVFFFVLICYFSWLIYFFLDIIIQVL